MSEIYPPLSIPIWGGYRSQNMDDVVISVKPADAMTEAALWASHWLHLGDAEAEDACQLVIIQSESFAAEIKKDILCGRLWKVPMKIYPVYL